MEPVAILEMDGGLALACRAGLAKGGCCGKKENRECSPRDANDALGQAGPHLAKSELFRCVNHPMARVGQRRLSLFRWFFVTC